MLFFVPAVEAPTMGPLDFFFNVRSRYEQKNDVFFSDVDEQNRTLIDTRARLGFDYDAGDDTTIRVTYQFSNVQIDDEENVGNSPIFQWGPGAEFRAQTRQDLSEAYLQHKSGDSTMTIGRQHIDRGVGKLMGSNDWGEVGRTWNGARFETGNWDVFAGRLDLDRNNDGREMLYYTGYDWGTSGVTTLTYAANSDDAHNIYTVDHFWGKQLSDKAFVGVQAAWQWGRHNGDDLEAWAATVHFGFEVSDAIGFFAQYSTASGGEAADGTDNTFHDLYPSDHGHYGIMDLQAWRNVNALSFGLGYELSDDMNVGVAYHDFTLNDADDMWFNGGNGFQYGYGGNGVDDVGSEIDVVFNWDLQDNLGVSAGFAIFDPGAMIAASGGGTNNQTWFYAGLNWKY